MPPEIGTLWIEGRLTFIEICSLLSFIETGHKVTLFTYGGVENCPEGIDVQDAREIDADEDYRLHVTQGSPALKSDVFRYRMLQKTDLIWSDCDQIALAPFDYDSAHLFCESWGLVNNNVLRLPKSSDILKDLVEITGDEYYIPFWYDEAERRRLEEMKRQGTPVHVTEMDFGVFGPQLVGHLLIRHDLIKYALPASSFNAFPPRLAYRFGRLNHEELARKFVKPWSRGVHLWGHMIKKRLKKDGQTILDGSVLDHYLKKYGVNPSTHPVAG